MKKILLVDNYKPRLEKFRNEYYAEYSDILIAIENMERDISGTYSQLMGCALILLHKNYFEDGLLAANDICEEANVNDVDCLLFSGEEGDVIPVNSMYKNLPDFLYHYKLTGEIVTEILRYGNLYFLEEPFKIREEIFKELFEQGLNNSLELSTNSLKKIKRLLFLLKYSDKEISQSMSKLESQYSVEDFKNKLDKLIQKSLI